MDRRSAFFRSSGPLSLVLVLICLLALAGCPPVPKPDTRTDTDITRTTGPLDQVAGAKALKEAQNTFDEASKQVKSGEKVPAEARAKYQQVVDIVEKRVLPQVSRDDLKVTAYALEAFSKWKLDDYIGAQNTAEKGKKLCGGAAANPRDCAMLQMVAGLVVASQAYDKYKDAPKMSLEEMKGFANRMEAALQEINAVNRTSDPRDSITIYANQWQLLIIRQATNFWYTYFRKEAAVWKPEVLKWLSRADQVGKKFPAPPYLNQERTLKLQEEFGRLKKKAEEPS